MEKPDFCWCHQCNAEVILDPLPPCREGNVLLICSNCGGGFVEVIEPARNPRRRRPRRADSDMSPRELARFLQFLEARSSSATRDHDQLQIALDLIQLSGRIDGNPRNAVQDEAASNGSASVDNEYSTSMHFDYSEGDVEVEMDDGRGVHHPDTEDDDDDDDDGSLTSLLQNDDVNRGRRSRFRRYGYNSSTNRDVILDFENLLQQHLMLNTDNDNSTFSSGGAPPASRSAVDSLPVVFLQKKDMVNGMFPICAVCKDEFKLNEPLQRMPCRHCFHSPCILPWLEIRNSCPVCRYELPTDDADYEDSKWKRARDNRRDVNEIDVILHDFNVLGDVDEAGGESEGDRNMVLAASSLRPEMVNYERDLIGSRREADLIGSRKEAAPCHGDVPAVNRNLALHWLDMLRKPLFGVVGLLVVSRIGNLFLGPY